MGQPRGFIEIERKNPEYRDKDERIKDYNEVELPLNEKDIREQAARCMDCGIPFCHGCGCPLANIIPEWNDLVYRGHWREALDLLTLTNPFPEFTGRICPAPCEASCTVNINGEPVTIRQIELNIVEKAFKEGYILPEKPEVSTGKKIAVIGSGPAGLAVAVKLKEYGHEVVVFEQDNSPGGLLQYGIPDFKLNKQIVRRRIDVMKKSGIIFETGVSVGKDVALSYLMKKFDAICLACGSREPRMLPVPGADMDGIHTAMDFLVQQNKRISGEPFSEKDILATDKDVVVIGGGDTGSDCVGTSIRQGAKSVTQIEIMPKPPEKRSEYTPWPLWPYQLRTSSSHKEGCERLWNIMTKSFEGIDGKVSAINAVKVEWDIDNNGKPVNMKEVSGSDIKLKADLVLLAMGFTGPEKQGLMTNSSLETDRRGNIKIDENGMTNIQGVFAAGDMVSGPSLVVRAIAAGVKLSEKVHAFVK